MKSAVVATISILFIFVGMQLSAENCHEAIQAKVIANNPGVEKVTFDDTSETRAPSGKDQETQKGRGQFLRHTGKWEDITWTCNYDTKNYRVIIAEYSVISKGPATYQADTSKGWAKECQDALRSQVNEEHKNAQKVVFKTALESQYSSAEKLLEGDGYFERQDGVKKNFTYRCIYNTRKEQIAEKTYRLE